MEANMSDAGIGLYPTLRIVHQAVKLRNRVSMMLRVGGELKGTLVPSASALPNESVPPNRP